MSRVTAGFNVSMTVSVCRGSTLASLFIVVGSVSVRSRLGGSIATLNAVLFLQFSFDLTSHLEDFLPLLHHFLESA